MRKTLFLVSFCATLAHAAAVQCGMHSDRLCGDTAALTVGVADGGCNAKPTILGIKSQNLQCIQDINCTHVINECGGKESFNAFWECAGCNVTDFGSSFKIVGDDYFVYTSGKNYDCSGTPTTSKVGEGCLAYNSNPEFICNISYINYKPLLDSNGGSSAASVFSDVMSTAGNFLSAAANSVGDFLTASTKPATTKFLDDKFEHIHARTKEVQAEGDVTRDSEPSGGVPLPPTPESNTVLHRETRDE